MSRFRCYDVLLKMIWKYNIRTNIRMVELTGPENKHTRPRIILVTTHHFQEYILCNIKQLLALNYEVTVITEPNKYSHFDDFSRLTLVDSSELDTSRFDNVMCGGRFWALCAKRLFLVYGYMKKYDIGNCIHLENDVMLYVDFNNLDFDTSKIHLVMDSDKRCIPGIVYVPHFSLLDDLVTGYDFGKNDMINMSMFFKRNMDICEPFPIIKRNKYYDRDDLYNKNFSNFEGVFDGAAMGQYLGGIDPRNRGGDTRGFINETCVVKYNHYKFVWVERADKLFYPHIVIGSDKIPIYNLHIHCKRLNDFMMANPLEQKLIARSLVQ